MKLSPLWQTKITKKHIFCATLVLLLIIMFSVMLAYNLSVEVNQQFVYLADSFLSGKLYFQNQHEAELTVRGGEFARIWTDTSFWQGRRYWPLGPFPSVLLMPFVALFGAQFLQGYLSFALTLLNFFLLWRIARKLGFGSRDSIWLSAFFLFGTVYLGLAAFSVSWYFAQVVAATLIIASIDEFLDRPRWWLIGLYLAAAFITRANLIFAALFFITLNFWNEIHLKEKFRNLIQLCFSVAAGVLLILLYNWARFENFFESGYALQDIPPSLAKLRDQGLFSLKHLPANLFFLLFRGPNPVLAQADTLLLKYPYITADIWGMGIFFSSPLLLYIFSAHWRDKLVKAASLAALFIAVPIITYYGIGVSQIGYRYALDFLPFIYVILCKALSPRLPLKAKLLIIWGIILNWHLLLHFRS